MNRAVILRDFAGSPDHNHTRNYKKGESFEVGSTLMPQAFVDALLTQYVPSGRLVGLVSLEEMSGKTVEPCIKVEEKSLTDDAKKAQQEAHIKLYGSESYRPADF